jgi:hypothetical protein
MLVPEVDKKWKFEWIKNTFLFKFQVTKPNENEEFISENAGSKRIQFYKGRDTVSEQHSFFAFHYGLVISVFSTSHWKACPISFFPDTTQFNPDIAQEIQNKSNIHPNRVAERYCFGECGINVVVILLKSESAAVYPFQWTSDYSIASSNRLM